ncbi:MAG: phosphate uptake regulator PhoU [Candidatus Caldarchaeum sp.]|uniref:Phosphate uptake regulator PhoU n=1 Tax=Caldiarchaeum subterraneum TaxID=311458 RepID=A0A7C5LER3_CALS0
MQVFTRRIQQTGKSTYIVSLPREWVAANNLKKFDQVRMIPVSTGLLITVDSEAKMSEAEIRAGRSDTPAEAARLFFSKYLEGYAKIRVTFPEYSPQTMSFLKERIRRWLVGVEIVEESSTEMLAQCLPMHDKLPVKLSIERMGSITSNMVVDAINSVVEANKSLAEEVISRDDEVDRFYHFVTRQLNAAVRDYSVLNSLQLEDPAECIAYVLVAKSIERAADHAVNICKRALHSSSGIFDADSIVDISEDVVGVFKSSLTALLGLSIKKANETMTLSERVAVKIEQLQTLPPRKKEKADSQATLLTVLGSLRRIAEYSEDIAEAAINIASRKVT